MNTQFTDKQIEAYAAAFREGDAVWSDGKWWETFYEKSLSDYGEVLANESNNAYYIQRPENKGVYEGFKAMSNVYRVTTLKDYKLQGGEKIVWLRESDEFRTFGKVYEVDNYKTFTCDKGISNWSISGGKWGIIPSYEQVKCEGKRDVTDEEFDNFLNELDKTLGYAKKDNQLEHVVHYPTAADREEEVLKLKTFELMLSEQTVDELIEELKEVAHIEINKGNYDEAEKAIELIKAWEDAK